MSPSVNRVFQILEYLAQSDDWVSLRVMARHLNIDPTTVYRILCDLKELGYVRQQSADSRYQLSLKIASISARLLDKVQVRQMAVPFMEGLTSKINETTHLAILDDPEFVYIHKVNNDQAVRMRSAIGQRGQLYCTAVGKSLLAFMPKPDVLRIAEKIVYERVTPNTITSKEQLLAELDQIRIQGYAVDDEENEVGIRCVGAPIFDYSGNVAGALSISGWTISMTKERLPEVIPELLQTTQQISTELGYSAK